MYNKQAALTSTWGWYSSHACTSCTTCSDEDKNACDQRISC